MVHQYRQYWFPADSRRQIVATLIDAVEQDLTSPNENAFGFKWFPVYQQQQGEHLVVIKYFP
jgi:hypothetical protein